MVLKRHYTGLTAVVLAAGGSSRYGECKQLVEINGASLIRRAVNKLLSILRPGQVNVVTGASSEAVVHDLVALPVNVVHNALWQSGIASSLKAGVKSVKPDCRAIMIVLCDQALVSVNHLEQLTNLWIENPTRIIASAYADTFGTPAIIPIDFRPQLLELEGDTGAKSILQDNVGQLIKLPAPEAEFDLDIPTDLEKIRKLLDAKQEKP